MLSSDFADWHITNSSGRDVYVEGVKIESGRSAQINMERISAALKRVTVKVDDEVRAQRTFLDPEYLAIELLKKH